MMAYNILFTYFVTDITVLYLLPLSHYLNSWECMMMIINWISSPDKFLKLFSHLSAQVKSCNQWEIMQLSFCPMQAEERSSLYAYVVVHLYRFYSLLIVSWECMFVFNGSNWEGITDIILKVYKIFLKQPGILHSKLCSLIG